MAFTYVTLPDDISQYGQYKNTIYSGLSLRNEWENGYRFVRGIIDKDDNYQSVHRSYTLQATSEWFPFSTGKNLTMTAYVRFSNIDQSVSENWISFITVALNSNWSRVVTVNYDKDSGLHMYHLPTQGVRTGYTRHSNPVLLQDIWHKIRLDVNLNNGDASLYYGEDDTLVETNVVTSYGSYAFHHYHSGLYCYGGLTEGYMDNRSVTIGLEH